MSCQLTCAGCLVKMGKRIVNLVKMLSGLGSVLLLLGGIGVYNLSTSQSLRDYFLCIQYILGLVSARHNLDLSCR